MRDPDAALAEWRGTFGGGMIPFDAAYHAALRDGHTIAEAQMRGGHALLAAFTAYLQAPCTCDESDAASCPAHGWRTP